MIIFAKQKGITKFDTKKRYLFEIFTKSEKIFKKTLPMMKKHGIQNLGHDANRTREKRSSTESNRSDRIERGKEGSGSRNIV